MSPLRRTGRWTAREHLRAMVGRRCSVLVYMFVPIFVVVLMSFNNPTSRLTYSFDGFSCTTG